MDGALRSRRSAEAKGVGAAMLHATARRSQTWPKIRTGFSLADASSGAGSSGPCSMLIKRDGKVLAPWASAGRTEQTRWPSGDQVNLIVRTGS